MRRRDFIQGISIAGAWPFAARAQQPASVPLIGWLNAGFSRDALFVNFTNAFRTALKEVGYVEGKNVEIEFRWAEGDYTRLPALAAELVAKRVAVILAGGPAAAPAAQAATKTIPIVFTVGADPVALGLIASLSHPGGNATGVSIMINELESKQLELLREVVPGARTIAILLNPNSPSFGAQSKDLRESTRSGGVEVILLSAANPAEIDQAFGTLRERHVAAILVGGDPFLTGARNQLVELAARQAIPVMYPDREAIAIGGLLSYGASIPDAYHQAGLYVGRILKGEKPADLPVVQSTKFELVINLKTAKALGLTVPDKLIALADAVLE